MDTVGGLTCNGLATTGANGEESSLGMPSKMGLGSDGFQAIHVLSDAIYLVILFSFTAIRANILALEKPRGKRLLAATKTRVAK